MARSTTKREREEAFRAAGIVDPKTAMSGPELQNLLNQARRNLRGPNKKAYRRPTPGQIS